MKKLFVDRYGEFHGWVLVTGFVSVIVAIMGALVFGCIVGANHSDHVDCLRLHEQTGLDTRYARSGPDGECYIRVGDQWVPKDNWRVTNSK